MSKWSGIVALSALVAACATTNPIDEDSGVQPPDQPDATKSTADADPEQPDAPPRPDAGPPDAMLPPDAMPPPPDAAVPHPDAAVPHPDAAVPHPDAAPPDAMPQCTPQQVNLLSNANFDTGPGAAWAETGGAGEIILSGTALMGHTPHSGTYAAWLGGYNSGTDVLTQTIAVPAGATNIHFKGQRWIETAETDSGVYDKLAFAILPATGTTVSENVGGNPAYTNNSTTTAWTAFDFPVTGSYAGQTIRLRLTATTDIINASSFFLDTLSLEATVCQ